MMTAVVLLASTVSPQAETTSLKGWGKLTFGQTPAQVAAALDNRVEDRVIEGSGTLIFTTQIGGDDYVGNAEFYDNALDAISFWNVQTNLSVNECHKVRQKIVGSIEDIYGRMKERPWQDQPGLFPDDPPPRSGVQNIKEFQNEAYISVLEYNKSESGKPACEIIVHYACEQFWQNGWH
jgi:hypothetical protein